ncbi:MAG: hypothetical protein LBT00_14695 [Spirochaetaceae bacterium]|nr:hypothetical protein [Spirochaetaceae bacterium]
MRPRHCEQTPSLLRAGGTLPGEAIRGEGIPRLDCFGLRPRNDDATVIAATPLRHCDEPPRHCERSEAIQCESLPRLDCFVASLLAMTPSPLIP